MATLPPWHALKIRAQPTNDHDSISENVDWVCPSLLNLEKHVRFYRDLLRSTEKVELTLSHSGKKEVAIGGDSPFDPTRPNGDGTVKHDVILVPIKTDLDPRVSLLKPDGSVDTRAEYKDPKHLEELISRRESLAPPAGSKTGSPVGSPRSRPVVNIVPVGAKPPPPAGSRPPPPPKAPPPETRLRQDF